MVKMIKGLVAFILFVMVEGFGYAYALQLGTVELEVEPYLKGGTIAWDQLGGVGGHKFLIAGGLNTNVKFDSFGSTINLEKWWVTEGLDDDEGIVAEDGYNISMDFKYFLKTGKDFLFYPYADIGYERWDREKAFENWRSLKFFNLGIGAGLAHEKGYIRAAITRPFSVSAQNGIDSSPRYGFSAEGGIKLKAFLIGLFYKYAGFEDPDAKMTQSGLFIGYRFK